VSGKSFKSVTSFTDFLLNQVSVGDLVLVSGASNSSAVLWLGECQAIQEWEKPNYYGPSGWQKVPYSVTYEYKIKVQAVHPGANNRRYPHHTWETQTNTFTGETEYIGRPRVSTVDSGNVVRYLTGIAPILDDTDWSQKHVLRS
jgi:hypothetical protein